MGLLDWLNDSIGSSMQQDATGTGAMLPQTMPDLSSQTPPMPPVQSMDMPSQGAPPLPQGGDPMAADVTPPGAPPTPPLPRPRPAMADAGPPTPPLPPSNMAPAPPPAAPMTPPTPPVDLASAASSYQNAGGSLTPAPSNPQAKGIIGRALGLDPNREAQVRSAIGAGLKAAGNSAGKSPMQAFASGAGEGIEAGKGADDKTTDQQSKYLAQAIAAAPLADKSKLMQAQTQEALANAKSKMTGGGKDSVMNSDAQLYLRAQGATNQDAKLKLLKSQYDAIVRASGDPSAPEAKQAQKAYNDLYDQTMNGHLTRLGLDPKDAAKIGKQPGMSLDNPVPKEGLDQKKFDALPPGSYFINPKDGRVLVKKGTPVAAAGGAGAPAPQSAPTPGATPPLPPAGAKMSDAGAPEEEED